MSKNLIKFYIVVAFAVFAIPFSGSAQVTSDTTTVEQDSFVPDADTTTVEENDNDEFVPDADTTTVEENDEEITEDDNDNGGSSRNRSRGSRSRLPSEPTVLGASTGPNGTTLSCAPYLIGFAGIGRPGNIPAEVAKLQGFLNEFMGETLPVTGFFGSMTDAAVKRLQGKYSVDILKPWDEAGLSVNLQPTGYEYIMTRWFVNTQICKMSNVVIPKPDLKKEVGA